jgi:hypothetical protein
LAAVLCCPASAFAANPGFGFVALTDAVTVLQGSAQEVAVEVSTLALPATALPAYPIVLSTGDLPAGITASFSALSITNAGTATLTIVADGTTPPGSYLLELDAGTADLLSSRALGFTLTVLSSPDFSLAVTPTQQSVVQGVTATYTVDATALSGFVDSVDFAVTGLPSGATGAFDPATVAAFGQSTLTIGTSAATVPGSYPITVTGTSNALQHSVTLQLTIEAPAVSYLLSASPGAQTVVQGATANYLVSTLLADGSHALASNAVTVSGLPAGASATLTPAATQGNVDATLLVTTSLTTPPGDYALSLGSALAASITVQLVVAAAPPTSGGSDGDVPLPGWALVLLAASLLGSIVTRPNRGTR